MALIPDSEKWIMEKMKSFPYGYYEIAYVLEIIKNKFFAEEILLQSRKRKICATILVHYFAKKIGVLNVN